MSEGRRGAPARLGLSALNIVWPGLGLLRVRADRRTALLLAGPLLFLAVVDTIYLLGPTLGFAAWATLMLGFLTLCLALIVFAIVLTWRDGTERRVPLRRWSRWYGMLAAWLLLVAGAALVNPRHFYRLYYTPAESMAPTLRKNDRLVARMGGPNELRRGQIVLLRVGEYVYVKRVAALPGDRIGMANGVVILNGEPVPQRSVAEERVEGYPARRLAERFPGERREHFIYDLGQTVFDDFAEVLIPPGHVFVLGDNRDMSADSRVPRDQSGVGLARTDDVIGVPLFFSWWPGMAHSGQPIAD